MKKLIIILAVTFIASIEAALAGTIYNVKQDGTGNFTTIQACANAAVAGDTCAVYPGLYDERVAVTKSGMMNSPIVFKAATTIKPQVRAFTLTNANYITVDGLEVTNIGMSTDYEYHGSVLISGGTGVRVLNNDIHDTSFGCIGYGNVAFLEISGNRLDHCGVAKAIIGNPGGPYAITAGVNDQVKFRLNNATSYTITLTPGSARTSSQICADINAVSNVPAVPWTSAITCSGGGGDGRIHIYPYFNGPDTSVILESVANDAYAALGLRLGSEVAIGHSAAFQTLTQPSSDVLIQNNQVSRVSDFLLPSGRRFVFRDNVLGPSDPATTTHIDGVQSNNPSDFILIEGNRSVDNASSDNHFLLTSTTSNNWIVRFNSTLRSKGGQSWGRSNYTIRNWAHYQNTWYGTVDYYFGWNQIGLTNSTDNVSRNNIWYRAVRNPGGNPYYVGTGSTMDRDYDLLFESGDAQEANDIHADPLFTDAPNGDFNLQGLSPARDAGGPLTVAVNSGSASVSLKVGAAYVFQPGWAGTQADRIAVGSTSNSALISSIDYTTNTITLDSPLSWSVGDPVWLYSDSSGKRVLYGPAPDIGAYECAPSILYGDVSENGSVTAYDASLAAQYAVGVITLTSSQVTKAEVSGNGSVTSFDASLIAQYAVGLITKFPVQG